MKSFFGMLKRSAGELDSIRCIVISGILTALFIVLDICSINIGGFIKVNFNFLALAATGMMFGPVPAMMAAVAGDLIGCMISGTPPLPLLTVTAALSGFIYGVFLYGMRGGKLVIFSIISRIADSFIVSFALNTAILMHAGFMSKTGEQVYLRYGSTALQLACFIPVMVIILPAVRNIYDEVIGKKSKT